MIYFVRHGQTDYNKNKIMMGHTDIPLNEEGIIHAYKLKEQLKNINFDLVYCSTLQRAKQTCDIIFEDRNQAVVYRDELRERDYKDFEGKPKSSFDYNKFWDYSSTENIEDFFEFAWPVTKFVANELLPNAGKKILIISHGGVAKWFEVLLSVQSLAPDEMGPYLPKNSEISMFVTKRQTKNPYVINIKENNKLKYSDFSIITPNIINFVKQNSDENSLSITSNMPKFYFRSNFILLNDDGEILLQHFSKTNEYKLVGKGLKKIEQSPKELKEIINLRTGLNVSPAQIKNFEDIFEIRFDDPVGEVVFTRTYYVKLNGFGDLPPTFSEKEIEEGGSLVVLPLYDALKLSENSLKKVKTLEKDSKNYRPLKTKESIVFRDQVLLRRFLNFALNKI